MGVIAKKSFVVTFINLIGIVIGAVGILFIQTKYLSQEEIGALKTLNALAMMIFPFILLGFGTAIYRFYHFFEDSKKELNQFLSFVILLPLFFLIFYITITFLLKDFIDFHFFKNSPYLKHLVYLLPGMVFHNVYLTLFDALLTNKNKIFLSNFLKNVVSRVYLILLVMLYAFKIINFDELFLWYILLHILNAFIIGFNFLKTNPIKLQSGFIKNKRFKKFSIYSGYIIFASLSGVIVSQIDTLMTGSLTQSLGKVGVYTVAFFMGVVIETPKKPVVQLSIPLISKHLSNENTDEVEDLFKKSAINLLILGGVIFIIIWGNINSIFNIIPNGQEYIEGKYVVFFIALSKLFDLAVGINFELIHYSKFYRWNIFLTPLLAVIAIITNFYFITAYGIVGTAIATAISILLYNTISSIVVYKKLKMNSITYRHFIVGGLMALAIYIGTFVFIQNPLLSILIKTTIMILVFLLPIYFLKISPEINRIVSTVIKKISSTNKK